MAIVCYNIKGERGDKKSKKEACTTNQIAVFEAIAVSPTTVWKQ